MKYSIGTIITNANPNKKEIAAGKYHIFFFNSKLRNCIVLDI